MEHGHALERQWVSVPSPAASTPSRARSVLAGLVLSAVSGAALGPVVVLELILLLGPLTRIDLMRMLQGAPPSPATFWWNAAYGLAFFAAGPLLYVWLLHPGRPPWAGFGLRRNRRAAAYAIFGAGLGVAALWLLMALDRLVSLPEGPEAFNAALARALDADPSLLFVIPLAAAVGEEILFRGFLQPRIGLILSSVLFGVLHFSQGSWFAPVVTGVFGLLFGLLYRRTGTLWAPLAAHFAYDFVALVLLARS